MGQVSPYVYRYIFGTKYAMVVHGTWEGCCDQEARAVIKSYLGVCGFVDWLLSLFCTHPPIPGYPVIIYWNCNKVEIKACEIWTFSFIFISFIQQDHISYILEFEMAVSWPFFIWITKILPKCIQVGTVVCWLNRILKELKCQHLRYKHFQFL